MKYLLPFFLLVVSLPSFADSKSQAIQDKTSLLRIKQGLEGTLAGRDFIIKDYSKSWDAYNPMSWVIDGNRSYRNITFEFTDVTGKKQEFYCSLNIVEGNDDVIIHSCEGGDKHIGEFHQLRKYGYFGGSIMVEDIVTVTSGGGTNSSPKTAR